MKKTLKFMPEIVTKVETTLLHIASKVNIKSKGKRRNVCKLGTILKKLFVYKKNHCLKLFEIFFDKTI